MQWSNKYAVTSIVGLPSTQPRGICLLDDGINVINWMKQTTEPGSSMSSKLARCPLWLHCSITNPSLWTSEIGDIFLTVPTL